ncbi:PKD domain-containing protein [Kribbella sp. NPDC020789]
MNRAAWLIPPSVVATLAYAVLATEVCVAGGVPLGHQTASSTATDPKPVVTGKAKKHGAQLTAVQRSRLTGSTKPATKPAAKKHTFKKLRPGRAALDPRADERRPFRLNLGMCGQMQPDGTVPGPDWCQPTVPEDPRPTPGRTTDPTRVQPRPTDVTWEQVLTETKDALFPALTVHVQPADRTLVNADTIVYADDRGVTRVPLQILGFPVVVEALPTSYTWHFGDGSSKTTDSPGKPYPSKEITHKYMKRADVRLTVTVNYSARFNVAGTGWQPVPGTIPVTGPATPLQVREAVPVLVDPPR